MGTRLGDSINSELTRWRLTVWIDAVVYIVYSIHVTVIVTESGRKERNPLSKHQIQPARDGTAEPLSRDQLLGRERGQGTFHFSRSAGHEQDW